MKIIDLSKPHLYNDCSIQSVEKIQYHGKEYEKITYALYPPTADDEHRLKRVAKVVACILSCLLTSGLIFFSANFRNLWYSTFKSKVEVLSAVSLETHLRNRIFQCPSANELYLHANKAVQNIYLQFYPKDSNPKNLPKGSNACANSETGELTLVIGDVNEDRILTTIIFELTNFLQSERFQNLLRDETLNADQFAEEAEHIEYDGACIHHQIIQQAIKTNNWNPRMDRYPGVVLGWQKVWNFIRHSEHAEYYRSNWKQWQTESIPKLQTRSANH